MKRIQILATALYVLTLPTSLYAQDYAKISAPELELKGNEILISYQILQGSSGDFYRIWIEVTDDNGNILNARSLRGDVGDNIRGGANRQIAWDYEKDVVSLDDGSYVQVLGELMNPKVEEKKPEIVEQPAKAPSGYSGPSISKPSALLRSVAFPGWGLSVMHPGKPHWLKGVLGYGAIASTVVFNRMAIDNYNKYLESSDEGQFGTFYDQAESQQQISTISAYVAVGVWVSDIVWTLVSNPDNRAYQSNKSSKGISLGSGFDPAARAPVIAFRYHF